MPEITSTTEAYESARSFWKYWHEDPNADEKFGTSNGFDVVIPGLIERHDLHPIQARFIARIGLESALETLDEGTGELRYG